MSDPVKQKQNQGAVGAAPSCWRQDWLLGLLLLIVTLIVYQPVWHAGFIWDDDAHVTRPDLRSLNGLVRIWTELGATQQYYPFACTVFWVEHKLWGDSPLGYHLINVLLHVFSALLLVKLLRRLKIPGAWLAAALFALHPVEVESVAWVSELKNTLSGALYLGAALVYLEFDRNRRARNYAVALGLFLLALMSKTVTASLPAALLVVFWWQRGKLSWKRDALPLIPFCIAGVGAGLVTAWVERHFLHAEGSEYNFSVVARFLIAGRDIWFYLGKLVWPVDLAFYYPTWKVSPAVWWQYLFPAAVLLLLGALARRRGRGPLAALLFFVGTLFPALGFFNVYPFRYSLVADHFQYLASLGPLTLAAAGISALTGFFRKSLPFLEPILCATLLLVLGTLSWKQCGMYTNNETLWQKTYRLNPDSWMAHNYFGLKFLERGQLDEAVFQFQKALEIKPDFVDGHDNLGVALMQEGRADESILQFQKALEIKPGYADAYNSLGTALLQKGKVEEAITNYQEALRLKPDYADAHFNWGLALFNQKKMDEAITQYQEALRIEPDYAAAHNNLGNILRQQGKLDEAIVHFRKALQANPESAKAHVNLGIALLQKGEIQEAASHFQKALEIKPNDADAHYYLGNILRQAGSAKEAIAHFQEALQIQPGNPLVENNLAWLLATSPEASLRDGARAVELAQHAKTLLGGENAVVLHTLAAALAEAGRFSEAAETAQSALSQAETQSNTGLAAQIQSELKLYQAGSPFHAPVQTQ
jgi:protein O-mannosyl-transferase